MEISRAAPLHPILVHFTIGLVGASFVFDVLGQWKHSASLATAGWWTIALAVPLTVATVATGLMSRLRVPVAEGAALRYLRIHTALGPIFFGGERASIAFELDPPLRLQFHKPRNIHLRAAPIAVFLHSLSIFENESFIEHRRDRGSGVRE